MLTPDYQYVINGVQVKTKLIHDGTVWKDDAKARAAGFYKGCLYKREEKLSGGTGKVQWITIHNTADLKNVNDDAEQYTRATINQNMGSARVHFYVDNNGAWQNLRAGTGMFAEDPESSAEVGWHAGDNGTPDGGNMTSISIEIIENESAEHDAIAVDNGARIAAWLLWQNGIGIEKLVTHTFWRSKACGKTFSDVDVQCTNKISGQKWCPTYIFASNDVSVARQNWKRFKAKVKVYLDALKASQKPEHEFKVGDIVYYRGSVHYRYANGDTAYGCKGGNAEITDIYMLGKSKHPYHLKHVEKGCTVYGYVDEGSFELVREQYTPKVGDVVQFNGSTHYPGANSDKAVPCKGGKAKITDIYQLGKSKHPYHLVHCEKGCTVYGYVDEGTFQKG